MTGELVNGIIQEKGMSKLIMRPQDALLYDMELPLRQIFYPLGFSIEIITNDQDVLEAASESFGHVKECRSSTTLQVRIGISDGGDSEWLPEPTRREYSHLYSLVADVHNQALLDFNTGTSFAWLKKSTLNSRLYFRYNFLEKMVYLLLGAFVVTDIHAACISKRGKGILLCGNSGAGKSTLAYACAGAGWTYTSDDTSYLINNSKNFKIIGHAHRVRFRQDAKNLFPELEHREITPRMEGKPSIEVPVSELPLFSVSSDAEIHAIVYLNRHSTAIGRAVSLPPGTATKRMRQELFSAGGIRAKHEEQLEALKSVPTYELEYCNLSDGIEQLNRLVQVI